MRDLVTDSQKERGRRRRGRRDLVSLMSDLVTENQFPRRREGEEGEGEGIGWPHEGLSHRESVYQKEREGGEGRRRGGKRFV